MNFAIKLLTLGTLVFAFSGGLAYGLDRIDFLSLEGQHREDVVLHAVQMHQASAWWYENLPIHYTQKLKDGQNHSVTFFINPDELCFEDSLSADLFYTPLSFASVRKLSASLKSYPLTAKLVNLVYQDATIKLWAAPIAPDDLMTTSQRFLDHSDLIMGQLSERTLVLPKGEALVAGHKKDYVLTKKLFNEQGREAIYGWFDRDGQIIQPVSLFHWEHWVDYSHGVRLVRDQILVDGVPRSYLETLADPFYSELLSDEGPIKVPANFWQ